MGPDAFDLFQQMNHDFRVHLTRAAIAHRALLALQPSSGLDFAVFGRVDDYNDTLYALLMGAEISQ